MLLRRKRDKALKELGLICKEEGFTAHKTVKVLKHPELYTVLDNLIEIVEIKEQYGERANKDFHSMYIAFKKFPVIKFIKRVRDSNESKES